MTYLIALILLIASALVAQTPKQITYLYLWNATAKKWIGLNVTLDGLTLVPTTGSNAILRATASATDFAVSPFTPGAGLIAVESDGAMQVDVNTGYVATVTLFPIVDPGIQPGPCVVPGIGGTFGTASVVKTPTAVYTCVPDGKSGFVWSRQVNVTTWAPDPAPVVPPITAK